MCVRSLEAAGSERASIFGASEGGNLSVLFAATYPERVRALVLAGVYAKRLWSPDYPWAPTPEDRERENELLERDWAGEMDVSELAPRVGDDPELMRRITTFFRRSASPGAAVTLNRMNTQIDTRAVLPTIRVPTLVLHRTEDLNVKVEEARWIAQPGCELCRASGRRPPHLDRRHRRAARRGRGVPDRCPPRSRAGPCAGNRALH